MEFVPVIGLEIHSQLSTESKIFCGCSTKFGSEPNTQTCPVCTGQPGSLPVLNTKAVEYAVKAGIAMNCKISDYSQFARKNYFYPDLPKAYQISQFEEPLCYSGYIEIEMENKIRKIGITRIHLEEDAGKLLHSSDDFSEAECSYADYNRCGVPLIEIVSEPDITSAEEAYEYLISVKRILEYINVSDCNMEEGSLRCDANVSIKPQGSDRLGTKTEVKNMNSFKAVRSALSYEIKRQIKEIKDSKSIVQETRLWDENQNRTISMRTKEESMDYRYFPEPDLISIELSDDRVQRIREEIPEDPLLRKRRFKSEYNLNEYDALFMISKKERADFFEETLKIYNDPKTVANWIMADFSKKLNEDKSAINKSLITPANLGGLLRLINDNVISGKIAKTVFEEMYNTGETPEKIVEQKGLKQITDESEIEKLVEKVIQENPKAVEEFKSGKGKALGFLVGQIMRMTKGKANPQIVNKLIKDKMA